MPKTKAQTIKSIKEKTTQTYQRGTTFIRRRPFTSFFTTLALLLILIAAGNFLNRPPTEKPQPTPTKNVQIYSIGTAPKITVQGKINKQGVIQIVALAGGIIDTISVKEGDTVYRGTQILSLSSNYQGGNAPALQAQMAKEQYKNLLETYGLQVDNINKQKDIARKTHENSLELQNINAAASTASASLVNSNNILLNDLNQQLTSLQTQNQTNPDPALQSQIMTLRGTISQLQGGNDQLKQGQQQLAYQSSSNETPAQLAEIQKDLTLQQLEIQQKALDLNKEVTKIQKQLAEVGASAMFPASPFKGKIQHIHVKIGQSIAPGTPLATIAASEVTTTVECNVPQNIAQNISQLEPSNLYLGTHIYTVKPTFVSTEATNGTLYTILYTIPQENHFLLTDGQYITAEIPVGTPSTGSTVPFIPIDAIYQTQNTSYILLANKNKAETRQVKLGTIYGNHIEIISGLKSGDQVILNRNVVAGDTIKF